MCVCFMCARCHCSLVQECKALNARLIAYLKSGDAVHKLVSFVIEPAKSWASERQQQRFPFIACEVSSCQVLCSHNKLSLNQQTAIHTSVMGLPIDIYFCTLSVCVVLYACTVNHPVLSDLAISPTAVPLCIPFFFFSLYGGRILMTQVQRQQAQEGDVHCNL